MKLARRSLQMDVSDHKRKFKSWWRCGSRMECGSDVWWNRAWMVDRVRNIYLLFCDLIVFCDHFIYLNILFFSSIKDLIFVCSILLVLYTLLFRFHLQIYSKHILYLHHVGLQCWHISTTAIWNVGHCFALSFCIKPASNLVLTIPYNWPAPMARINLKLNLGLVR